MNWLVPCPIIADLNENFMGFFFCNEHKYQEIDTFFLFITRLSIHSQSEQCDSSIFHGVTVRFVTKMNENIGSGCDSSILPSDRKQAKQHIICL